MFSEIFPKRQILNFHGMGPLPSRQVDADERPYWSSESTLERAARMALANRNIEMTFDDGNLSDIRIAAPLLARHGLRARFFVLGGKIGAQDFLSKPDIRELDAMGMTIGSHGMDHVRWPTLDDAALDRELRQSRRILEDILGKPVLEAAIPFGAFDGRTLRMALDADYHRIYTSSGGFASEANRIQPRNSVAHDSYPVLGTRDRLISGVKNNVRLLKFRANGFARPRAGAMAGGAA